MGRGRGEGSEVVEALWKNIYCKMFRHSSPVLNVNN